MLKYIFLIVLALSLFSCSSSRNDQKPEVSFESPQNNQTISGIGGFNFVVEAYVEDDNDSHFGLNLYIKQESDTVANYELIAGMVYDRFLLNDSNYIDEEDGSYFFDTTTYENGRYNLKVTAEDSQGNTGSAEIAVTISN